MTRRCKGIAGCRQGWNFQARQDERAGIQDDGQGLHPGLLLVLRAVVGQDRVGEMALQNVGASVRSSSGCVTALLRRSSSTAVGGEPARASSREMRRSRREKAW